MKQPILDVIVVGAGQAGICTSFFLKKHGLQHLVFERGKIGESWRSQRWNSFILNTPNKLNLLAEDDLQCSPDEFATAAAFANSLDDYVTRHQLPVLEKVRVIAIDKKDVFTITVETNSQRQQYFSRQVIIASGAQNEKKLPAFAERLSADMLQLHTSEYRHADRLKEGAVLVAGSGQSGCQIVEDLLDAGRKVYFSTSMVARVPRQYRGRDIMDWLLAMKFFDSRPQDLPDPAMLHMKPPQLTGVGGNRTISLQQLAKKGAVIIGKTENADNKIIHLQPNAAQHVQFADHFSQMIKTMIDEMVVKQKLEAPLSLPDEADIPDTYAGCVTELTALDLEENNINNIVWATGFNCNFSYIKLPVLDAAGFPLHENGSTTIEGLYFVGLPWLRTRKSLLIHGAKDDAAYIVEQVCRQADSQPVMR